MSNFNKFLSFCVAMLLVVVMFFVFVPENQNLEVSIPSVDKPIIEAVSQETSNDKTVSPEFISKLMKQERTNDEGAKEFYTTLPGSLSDAPKPASLQIDAEGNLILNKRVQRLFEFYLMAMGEESIENIIARIKYDLQAQLNNDAYTQASNLLEGYLQYRNNIGVIKNQYAEQAAISGADMALIREIKNAIRESRSAFLPEDAISSFYSKEDDYDDYMISKIEILSNTSLSAEEKRRQLILLDEISPDDLIQAQKQTSQLANIRKNVHELRGLGASEDAVYVYREQALGSEVAARLGKLDEERLVWQSRVSNYRSELINIEAMDAYSDDEKHRMIEALRDEYFDGRETIRIRALDKMRTKNRTT